MYKEIGPGILSVKAFNSNDCRRLISDCEKNGNWKQAEISNYKHAAFIEQNVNLRLRNVEVKGPSEIPNAANEYKIYLETNIMPLIANYWDISNLTITGLQLAKYIKGSHIKPHNDTAVGSYLRCITSLLYLSSQYTGGELEMSDFGLNYSPSEGELLLFPSEYLHAVKPVLSGLRYCFVAFFTSTMNATWLRTNA